MKATQLSSRIQRQLGLRCAVEAVGQLALVLPLENPEPFLTVETRAAIVALGKELGFTHVAIELVDALGEARAPLRSD